MTPSETVLLEYYDEVFQVPEHLRDEYEKNPRKILQEYLESRGMVVNSVNVLKRASTESQDSLGTTAHDCHPGWYHYVYPASWNSNWVYIEC